MPKQYMFTFKLDDDDRRRLQALARREERTQSDILRRLIRRYCVETAVGDPLFEAPGHLPSFITFALAEMNRLFPEGRDRPEGESA